MRWTSPYWRQLGVQAHPVPALFRKKRLWMKHLLTFKDVIYSPCKLMSKDGQGLCLAVFPYELVPVFSGFRVPPEEKDGCFGECPFQMSIANLLSRGAYDLACRFLCTFDESAVRDKILHSGEPVDIMNLIENNKTEDPSNA